MSGDGSGAEAVPYMTARLWPLGAVVIALGSGLSAGCGGDCPPGVVIVPGGERTVMVSPDTVVILEGAERRSETGPADVEMTATSDGRPVSVDEDRAVFNLCASNDPSAFPDPLGGVRVTGRVEVRVKFTPAADGSNERIVLRNAEWVR